jgi:hypothetical protein
MRLHRENAAPDRDGRTEGVVQVAGGTQVVGVRVGFQDPGHPQAAFAHEGQHRVRGAG